jgi:SAM-dependent methyltransferase
MKEIKQNIISRDFRDNEDGPVLDFLDSLDADKSYSLLEVGSGVCRFIDKIRPLYPNIKITCLEINPDLAEMAKDKNFEVFNENFLQNTLTTESYDIVHCSHVIEHFAYPEVTYVLEELLRLTKKNCYCIIRSPLMWNLFYCDIDHVRPYPPEAIQRYFEDKQQQKKGSNIISTERIWYRTNPIRYIPNKEYGYLLRSLLVVLTVLVNKIFGILWIMFRFPASKPNGYVMIIKKLS